MAAKRQKVGGGGLASVLAMVQQLEARRQSALLLCWCYTEEHDLSALFLAPDWDGFGSLEVQNTLSSLGNDNDYGDDEKENEKL